MNADFFYSNAAGRFLFKLIQKTGAFNAVAFVLRTGYSRRFISSYVRKNNIDMTGFEGQSYRSFAEFFARKRDDVYDTADKKVLISPCDGLLSVYKINGNTEIKMKGSVYRIEDLIPQKTTADLFKNGICMVFRLEASDYHHFCSFDDLKCGSINFIEGQLHSVQPIAVDSVPVYRLNRRWWSLLYTENFGTAAQIEVGAMAVGGVTHRQKNLSLKKGEEMGNFELAGSTIVLLFNSFVHENLRLYEKFHSAYEDNAEIRVKMREELGRLIS